MISAANGVNDTRSIADLKSGSREVVKALPSFPSASWEENLSPKSLHEGRKKKSA